MFVTGCRYFLKNRSWFCEYMNYDDVELMDEMIPYDLIHALLGDIHRLAYLVMETRSEVNVLAPDVPVYDMFAKNVFDGIYDDHPAIDRYIELFGDEALQPWEF